MALDFQKVREDIRKMGEVAPQRAATLHTLRQAAKTMLAQAAQDPQALRERVQRIVRSLDPNLRCALPSAVAQEPLDGCFPLPPLPQQAYLIAADGSQIAPNRHAEVEYALVNVGAVRMALHSAEAPQLDITSRLLYDEAIYTPAGMLSDERLALERDLHERSVLADLAEQAPAPALVFTDGPLELWGAKDSPDSPDFANSLTIYQDSLRHLCRLGAAACGYVDKPAANLMTRLLEIASLDEEALHTVKKHYPYKGVIDRHLFDFLAPGDRSAVFAMQSRSAHSYRDELALHFFYLNVGDAQHPWLARVEIPAWVLQQPGMLDSLHAVLLQQCRILGSSPYPYILHRAHETAVVTYEESAQVTRMIVSELYRRGVPVGQASHKQAAKDLSRRTRR